jgi:hypothetical protein
MPPKKTDATNTTPPPPVEGPHPTIDPGPIFNPDAAIPSSVTMGVVEEPVKPPPLWNESKTRKVLGGTFKTVDKLAGWYVLADLTLHEDELDELAPPLTSIMNRHDTLRRFADHSDAMLVALALGGYIGRVTQERAENVLARLETREGLSPAPDFGGFGAAPGTTHA